MILRVIEKMERKYVVMAYHRLFVSFDFFALDMVLHYIFSISFIAFSRFFFFHSVHCHFIRMHRNHRTKGGDMKWFCTAKRKSWHRIASRDTMHSSEMKIFNKKHSISYFKYLLNITECATRRRLRGNCLFSTMKTIWLEKYKCQSTIAYFSRMNFIFIFFAI